MLLSLMVAFTLEPGAPLLGHFSSLVNGWFCKVLPLLYIPFQTSSHQVSPKLTLSKLLLKVGGGIVKVKSEDRERV